MMAEKKQRLEAVRAAHSIYQSVLRSMINSEVLFDERALDTSIPMSRNQ